MLGDHEIFSNAHRRKEPDVLEAADNACTRDTKPVHALQQMHIARGMLKRNAPDIGFVKTRDAVEGRCLTCAIGTDERRDVAGVRLERQIVNRDKAAETDSQMLDRENGFARAHGPALAGSPSLIVGSRCARSPCGRHTMISTIAAPKATMRNSAMSRNHSGRPTSSTAASTMPI